MIYLISDEPYRELAYDGVEVPYLTKYYKNTVVGYSYSKSLSLPGERIVKCQTVSVISSHIHFCIYAFLDDFLHKGWCINTSKYTVCNCCCCDDCCAVIQK